MRRLWFNQRGSTILELVAGGAIALIALGVLVQLQISAYRYQQADEHRFLAQTESTIALDRMVRDIRMASALPGYASGTATLTLQVGGESVTYAYDGAARQVVRTGGGQTLRFGRHVEQLLVTTEPDGRSLRVTITAVTPDGVTFEVTTVGAPRLIRP